MTHPTDQSSREQEAYWQGWCEAADWANRDDLRADRDSQAYADAMQRRLATLPPTAITAEEAGREGDGWRPIATAPKDGTRVLLSNGESVAEGYWLHAEAYIREHRDLEGRFIDQDEFDGVDEWMDSTGGMLPEPTYWQPLPPAPAQSGGQGNG